MFNCRQIHGQQESMAALLKYFKNVADVTAW